MKPKNTVRFCADCSLPAQVAAVVVTYNRKTLLLDCLEALLGQTRPVDMILLVDNASTDGTYELLAERGYLQNPRIQYRKLLVNEGGAGGFHAGTKWGHEEGYDWLWLMDDDSKPMPDALENLAKHFDQPSAVALVSAMTRPDGVLVYGCGKLKPCQFGMGFGRPITDTDVASVTALSVDFTTFVGLLVRRAVIDQVGFPAKEFFLRGDDTEYCARLRRYGNIFLILDSRIVHQEGQMKQVRWNKRFGRSSPRCSYENLWLAYFAPRNGVWLRLYCFMGRPRLIMGPVVLLSILVAYLRCIVGILLYDDHKRARIRFFSHAFYDGLKSNWDNQKPRKLLILDS